MSNLLILLLINLAAWPFWHWYFLRICDPQDSLPSGITLATILFLLTRELVGIYKSGTGISRGATTLSPSHSVIIVLLLALYALLSNIALPMVQALVIVVLNIFVISVCFKQAGKLAGFWCLCFLALPVIPSLQYYLGYPLRSLVAQVTSLCLASGSIHTTVEGTMLSISATQVSIDEPCSGIRYLWCALFTASILACLYRLNIKKTILFLCTASTLAIVANIVRAGNLALIEFGLQQGFSSLEDLNHGTWLNTIAHQGTGLIIYGLLFIGLLVSAQYLAKWHTTEQNPETPAPYKILPQQRAKYIVILATIVVGVLPLTCNANTKYGATIQEDTVETADTAETKAHLLFCHEQLSALQSGSKEQEASLISQHLTDQEAKFYSNFPGFINKFRNRSNEFIFRTIYKPTRMLHSSLECFTGSGYDITGQGIVKDSHSQLWRQFKAQKGKTKFLVQERTFDERGNTWTDLSHWYWSCLLHHTQGPWHSITVVKPL